MGRPSSFTQEIADKICEGIAEGKSLRSLCGSEEMPNKATVFRWLANDELKAFRDQYACAREAQADVLFDEVLEIADEEVTMVKRSKHQKLGDDEEDGDVEVAFDPTAVARNKLRVDARKWMAGKLRPKVYGEKLELAGDPKAPLGIAVIERRVIDVGN
jgi:hypothetical protein